MLAQKSSVVPAGEVHKRSPDTDAGENEGTDRQTDSSSVLPLSHRQRLQTCNPPMTETLTTDRRQPTINTTFLQAEYLFCHQTSNVKALKEMYCY